jgi:hypothetical protein
MGIWGASVVNTARETRTSGISCLESIRSIGSLLTHARKTPYRAHIGPIGMNSPAVTRSTVDKSMELFNTNKASITLGE